MLSVSQNLKNMLTQSDNINAKPSLIVEWNQNRYGGIDVVDNVVHDEDVNPELEVFPISSITGGWRPTRGIIKAFTNEARVSRGYDEAPGQRYYVASPDSQYKYWISPEVSASGPVGGKYFINNCAPYIGYKKPVRANKLSVTFENTFATPNQYHIDILSTNGNWYEVATTPAVPLNGQVILYRQANGTWAPTPYIDNNSEFYQGIRVRVDSITKGSSHLSLIEMSLRFEADISDKVISTSSSLSMSDDDPISPVGVVSSNTGTVTLSNITDASGLGEFNPDNLSSTFYNLIDANAKFMFDLIYDVSAYGGSSAERVRMYTLYSDTWEGTTTPEVTVNLKDSSKFFQEIPTPRLLLQNVSIGRAIWQLCDAIGYTNYYYESADDDQTTTIPYFWTNDDKTVWETFQDLCRTTQSVVYFDQYDVLQIMTRTQAFNKGQSVSWPLQGVDQNGRLADIIDVDSQYNFEANKVAIIYKPTKAKVDDETGFPMSEIVWEPDGDVVLRSSPLLFDFPANAMQFGINAGHAESWPYEGYVNIEGEIIRYKGKYYLYRDGGGTIRGRWVNSDDDKLFVDRNLTGAAWVGQNRFNGTIRVVERGVGNTDPVAHSVGISGWTPRYGNVIGPQQGWFGGFSRGASTMVLTTNSNFTPAQIYTAIHGSVYDAGYSFIGTRLKINSGNYAGLMFNIQPNIVDSYCINVIPTEACEANGRKNVQEISLYKRTSSGGFRPLQNIIGVPAVIARGVWYDLSVSIRFGQFTVFLNGQRVSSWYDPGTDVPSTGAFGLFVRGNTQAEFEYAYAIGGYWDEREMDVDGYSILDKISGGFINRQWDHDWLYKERTARRWSGKKSITYKQKYYQQFFDDFGPYVQELRQYDVKFDKPVLYSSIYLSNDSQAVVPEYVHTPFGAKFFIANASRQNAILNGEDKVTFGADNPVTQKMFVSRQTVDQGNEETYLVDKKNPVLNKDAIAARGEVKLEINSDWLQSKDAAAKLGDWIVQNWSNPADVISVQAFGNPIISPTDIVSIEFPAISMSASTHKYYVIAVSQEYDGGLRTTYTLRRAHV